jgi:hypothetical protein
MNKIGGSDRVREELTTAFAEGRGVTAKVRWVSRSDEQGKNKWIHCTPLLGQSGSIGVWMVVIVDDEINNARWQGGGRPPPTVATPERSWTPANGHRHPTDGVNGSSRNGGGSVASGSGSITSLRIV